MDKLFVRGNQKKHSCTLAATLVGGIHVKTILCFRAREKKLNAFFAQDHIRAVWRGSTFFGAMTDAATARVCSTHYTSTRQHGWLRISAKPICSLKVQSLSTWPRSACLPVWR